MNFEWEMEEEVETGERQSRLNRPESPKNQSRRWLYVVGAIVAAILAGLGWWRINLFDNETLDFLQAAVDLQTSAVAAQDGALYFTNYGTEPGPSIDKMHPMHIEFWLQHPQIDSFEKVELEIWAQAKWTSAENEILYRTLFFNDWNGSVRLKGNSDAYWGATYIARDEMISLTERDRPFEEQFSERISSPLTVYCGSGLGPACSDIRVTIGPSSFLPSDSFDFISPRLYGLTADGEIPESYWTYFDNRLNDLMGKTTVRFGFPDTLIDRVAHLAQAFEETAAGLNVTIELVEYDFATVDYAELLKTVDGAYFVPTLDTIASGAILPITGSAFGTHTDFFAQHWAGAWWQDQMWFLPLDGELIFISTDLGYSADFGNPAAPYPDWNWAEFETVMDAYTQNDGLKWGIAAPSASLLLSRAYGEDHTCDRDMLPVSCSINLSPSSIENALAFYAQNSDQISIPPAGTVEEQINYFVTEASVSVGNAAMWVSRPVFYEHDLTTRSAFVQPLPRLEDGKPIYPLSIRGGVVSSFSPSPISTYDFIEFLSSNEINPADRAVPARFETAVTRGFWTKLPPSIAPLMQEGFNQSRPIRIGELEQFRPEILEQVADGTLTPEEASRMRPPVEWFEAYFTQPQQAN